MVSNSPQDTVAGQFQTLVACNDCPIGTGGSIGRPIFLLTWEESGHTLRVVANSSAVFVGTPDAFSGKYRLV